MMGHGDLACCLIRAIEKYASSQEQVVYLWGTSIRLLNMCYKMSAHGSMSQGPCSIHLEQERADEPIREYAGQITYQRKPRDALHVPAKRDLL